MSMLRGVLEAQAPPKQNATDTINTLSSRLASATLLEDRRAAIQGLRSFAKEYPASVASGALRGLIIELQKDVEDVDTEKVVLETLLMLFNPNPASAEASEDIALWLADEFSQRQDNITVLLDLLETPDFYSRLYALQLLSAISASRPERTQECILSAPLGTTRLVAVLDDTREAVRSAGLLLLNDVTQGSIELQKLVAFENAFDRVFNLIQADGSLSHGTIIVQDCLSLLASLLQLNAANQSLFRETGFVARLSKLLANDAASLDGAAEDDLNPTREKNLWGFLAVLRMFLVPGNIGTQANQAAFEKHGLLQLILNLGFDSTASLRIRAEALLTCADMIRGNSKTQERFAHNKVQTVRQDDTRVNGAGRTSLEKGKSYVIDALLDVTLSLPSVAMFDVRYAACTCIQAYFYNHKGIRQHFLRRAIEGHTSGKDETSNVITIMINGAQSYEAKDPYRLWFAARIVFELIYDDPESKNMAMAIAEGDAANGEEVVTCIQALAGNLVASLQGTEDDRICVGYLMVLCGWLFEDNAAVNDFLTEGSTVQSIIAAASRKEKREVVQGLCTVLLGILYEFSTKDSPIPRRQLQPMLVSGLGREHYVAKITRLRQHPFLRDFEVTPQDLSVVELGELPLVFFDQEFVNFIKDNFSRISRAIDRDPGKEVIHVQEGVDRDLVDDLRAQIEDKKEALQKAEAEHVDIGRRLNQEQADHKRALESSAAEVNRIRNINEALQRGNEAEAQKTEAEHRKALDNLQHQHRRQIEEMEKRAQQATGEAAMRAQATAQQHGAEMSGLRRRLQDLETIGIQNKQKLDTLQRSLDTSSESVRQRDAQLATLRNDVQQRDNQLNNLKKQLAQKDAQLENLNEDIKDLNSKVHQLTTEVQSKSEAVDRFEKDKQNLEANIVRLHRTVKDHSEQATEATARESSLKTLNTELMSREKDVRSRLQELEKAEKGLQKDMEAKEEARSAAQTELDDLLIVLSDLEDKRTRDKKKLKELGAETSDDEDAEDADADADDDDDHDDNDAEEE